MGAGGVSKDFTVYWGRWLALRSKVYIYKKKMYLYMYKWCVFVRVCVWCVWFESCLYIGSNTHQGGKMVIFLFDYQFMHTGWAGLKRKGPVENLSSVCRECVNVCVVFFSNRKRHTLLERIKITLLLWPAKKKEIWWQDKCIRIFVCCCFFMNRGEGKWQRRACKSEILLEFQCECENWWILVRILILLELPNYNIYLRKEYTCKFEKH